MATTLPNPNRPVMAFDCNFTTGPPNPPGAARMSINSPATRCYVRKWDIERGRQFELDQNQAGMCTLDVVDPLESLNSLNGSSPYNTSGNTVTSYRPLGVYAYWPLTGNVFNTAVNSGFDPSFESGTSGFTIGGGGTVAQSTAQARFGTHSLLCTQAGNTSTFWPSVTIPGVPGYTATVSVYAFLTGGCSLQVQCPDGTNSTVLSTGSAWTRITVTYAQVNAQDKIVFAGTGVATPTFYLDGFQFEWATTASTFTTTGPTRYQIYSGYVERWPTAYQFSGVRSFHPLVAVDALAILSRTAISQSYLQTITSDVPSAFIPFDATSATGTVSDTIGMPNAQPLELPSPTGQISYGGDSQLDGTPALLVSQNNATNPPSTSPTNQSTTFEIIGRTFSGAPAGEFTVEGWLRQTTDGVVIAHGIGAGFDPVGVAFINGPWLSLAYTQGLNGGTNQAFFVLSDLTTGTALSVPWNSVNPAVSGHPDGLWHFAAMTLKSAGTVAVLHLDGVEITQSVPLGVKSLGLTTVIQNSFTGEGQPITTVSAARLGVYTRDIGATARMNHYLRGLGYSGEVSGTRVSRLLNQYWGGATSVAPGQLGLAPDFDYHGRTMLDVLQEIGESERGLLYVNGSGTVTWEDRTSRYLSQAPVAVFGENAAGGEVPYVDYSADLDPTYTFSQCNLSRPGNDTFPVQVNSATQAAYGQRVLTQTVQCNTDYDLTQAAIFYLNRYSVPKYRISTLKLNPAANPALWPVVLSLEISQRVTVKRRTPYLTTSLDFYIEQIHHSADADTGEWTVELQLSPVFVPQAWVLGDATYGVLGTTTVPVY